LKAGVSVGAKRIRPAWGVRTIESPVGSSFGVSTVRPAFAAAYFSVTGGSDRVVAVVIGLPALAALSWRRTAAGSGRGGVDRVVAVATGWATLESGVEVLLG
jgi:hypothetical protein